MAAMHQPKHDNPKRILAIDPGPRTSGMVLYDEDGMRVHEQNAEAKNEDIIRCMPAYRKFADVQILEMVGFYGMAVGRDIFETVRWIGIFQHAFGMKDTILHLRKDVKLALCNNHASTGANVRQAVLGLFPATGGGATPAIGTKPLPGPLYGVKSHSMSAMALAVSWRPYFESEAPWTRKS